LKRTQPMVTHDRKSSLTCVQKDSKTQTSGISKSR
jgi:hypothetical protein